MVNFWTRVSARTEADARGDRSAGRGSTTTDAAEIARLVKDWCDRRVRAEVMCGASGTVLFACFGATAEGAVRLDVVGGDPCPTLPLSLCIVTLHMGTVARVFFASLLGCEGTASKRSVWLQMPRAVAGADGRFTFRVPIFDDSGLETSLALGKGSWLGVKALDLSLTGVRVELPVGCPVVLNPDVLSRLKLEHAVGSVELEASVRRAEPPVYGLMFSDLVRPGGEIVASNQLASIVNALEHAWLRERNVA